MAHDNQVGDQDKEGSDSLLVRGGGVPQQCAHSRLPTWWEKSAHTIAP
eukprot:CAMPEP_0175912874 /NCGR_PEP_ID=MMETSP0108-20121206/8963_1 /TAXON_ID=195067 ORGANISM="Goniomonas pacifica, Strain CCMP1869" /NCGR_SAMPLE_ID=MMETSP0108 /ASSEMBLY_ACC=CAM_ASM_000204 /LENGTH=47 /DNA_ID= /DNA_START= /DNA_END= /DNA_ORIENTATION=